MLFCCYRSSAQVGMKIPNPTTAPHVGPGTFSDAYKPAIEVKRPDFPSYAFISYKPSHHRPASPDTFLPIPKFTEVHRKGPVFSEEVKQDAADSRNRFLQKIVKEKMTKIYPKLAAKKFPEKTASIDDEEDTQGFGSMDSEDYSIKKKKSFVFKATKKIK